MWNVNSFEVAWNKITFDFEGSKSQFAKAKSNFLQGKPICSSFVQFATCKCFGKWDLEKIMLESCVANLSVSLLSLVQISHNENSRLVYCLNGLIQLLEFPFWSYGSWKRYAMEVLKVPLDWYLDPSPRLNSNRTWDAKNMNTHRSL